LAEILVGRKAICAYLQISWSTVLKWIKYRDFPVLREKGCEPILNIEAVKQWETQRRLNLKKRPKNPGGQGS
jgi:predicted site-specific integrase-resolvase